MKRLLSLLLLVGLVGCSTGRMNTDTDLNAELRLNAAGLSADQTIVENAMTQPELSTLVAAVQRADLAGALSGPGPYTVFAPINQAFDGMDVSMMRPDQLRDVLTYHVVEGDLSAAELTDGMALVSLEGQELTIQRLQAGDPMTKVQDADIIYPDIEASNGRIHLINLVLDPTRGGTAQ